MWDSAGVKNFLFPISRGEACMYAQFEDAVVTTWRERKGLPPPSTEARGDRSHTTGGSAEREEVVLCNYIGTPLVLLHIPLFFRMCVPSHICSCSPDSSDV